MLPGISTFLDCLSYSVEYPLVAFSQHAPAPGLNAQIRQQNLVIL